MDRLRTRLIVVFLLAALLPALPLSWVVRDLLRRSFEPRAGHAVQAALEAGMEESRERLRALKTHFGTEAETRWRALIAAGAVVGPGTSVADSADVLVRRLVPPPEPGAPPLPAPLAGWAGQGGAAPPERLDGWLATRLVTADGAAWLVATPLPADVVRRAEALSEGLTLLAALRETRGAVLTSYIAPFLLTYLLLLALMAGLALLVARQIARPLEGLAAATQRLAEGDLEARVTPVGRGEVRDLEESFNRMVAQLGEQQRTLARLERAAAWRDMARRLAHEIKNPLTPIQLAVQELGQRYRGEDADFRRVLEASVEIVGEEIDALRRLVREFSEFARLPEPVRVHQPVAPLLEELAGLYGPERLTVAAPPEGATAFEAAFDHDELKRALINLVDNGLAAVREAGRATPVRLTGRNGRGVLELAVADDGVGIPPEALDHIFEPSWTTKSEGMGLGLAIVEGIVRGHGGTVRVDSRPGAGTTFTLAIPLAHREGTRT